MRFVEKTDDGVRVEQVLHEPKIFLKSRVSVGGGASFTAAMKSSSNVPTTASSQSHVSATGSRMILFPCCVIRTSLPSTRKRFGSLTACERPDQKTLAVSMNPPRYTFDIYHE